MVILLLAVENAAMVGSSLSLPHLIHLIFMIEHLFSFVKVQYCVIT